MTTHPILPGQWSEEHEVGPDYWEDRIMAVQKQQVAAHAEAVKRKGIPVATGVIDYFPMAIMAIPKNGDQVKLCGCVALISTDAISAILSLLK